MNPVNRPYTTYQANPMPYVAMLALAGGMFVSAPAVVLGIALARIACWARIEFAILAAFGAAWTALSWTRVELEMERAQRAAVRGGALEHPHAALAAVAARAHVVACRRAVVLRAGTRDRDHAPPLG